MARQVDHETTARWTCDICGVSDISSYSTVVTPTAPEGWVWLLTFRHDHEPRLSTYGGMYSSNEKKVIALPDSTKDLNPNVICPTCAKNLKSIVKDVKVSEVKQPDAPTPSKVDIHELQRERDRTHRWHSIAGALFVAAVFVAGTAALIWRWRLAVNK